MTHPASRLVRNLQIWRCARVLALVCPHSTGCPHCRVVSKKPPGRKFSRQLKTVPPNLLGIQNSLSKFNIRGPQFVLGHSERKLKNEVPQMSVAGFKSWHHLLRSENYKHWAAIHRPFIHNFCRMLRLSRGGKLTHLDSSAFCLLEIVNFSLSQ